MVGIGPYELSNELVGGLILERASFVSYPGIINKWVPRPRVVPYS